MNTTLINKINHFITNNNNREITGSILNQILRDMVTQTVAEVTYSQLSSLITNSLISPGTLYKITDRGDRGIFVTGVTDKMVSKDGLRVMLCPKTYAEETLDGNVWKGIWNENKAASVNDLFIWGGHVWKNLTGNIGTRESHVALDDINWLLVEKGSFSENEYVEVIMPVSYSFDNDWIERQWSPGRLSVGFYLPLGEPEAPNPVDVTDWNNMATIYYNVNAVGGVYNNAGCEYMVNVDCLGVFGNYGVRYIFDVRLSQKTYKENQDDNDGRLVNNYCRGIVNINGSGAIDGIPPLDIYYTDHTDDESFYFQYNFSEDSDGDPGGPIEDGNFVYLNMILHQDVLLTEMVIVGVGLTGDVGAKISIGLETDDETYLVPTSLGDLNNGVKVTMLGVKTTAPYRRFKITAVDGDITDGLLKVSGKYL